MKECSKTNVKNIRKKNKRNLFSKIKKIIAPCWGLNSQCLNLEVVYLSNTLRIFLRNTIQFILINS